MSDDLKSNRDAYFQRTRFTYRIIQNVFWAERPKCIHRKATRLKKEIPFFFFRKTKDFLTPLIHECTCFIRISIHIFNFNVDNHDYSTRSKDEPISPLYKTSHLKYSAHFSCVNIYQNIPYNILNLPNNNFRSQKFSLR